MAACRSTPDEAQMHFASGHIAGAHISYLEAINIIVGADKDIPASEGGVVSNTYQVHRSFEALLTHEVLHPDRGMSLD